MPDENRAIAIIPSECFRWQPRVQFMESFRTRAAALNFAFQQGYNLIVERNQGGTSLFDVLLDTDGVCTSGLDLELLKTEEVLVDSYREGWTALMLWTMWDLAKRFAALVAILYARQIVPLSRRAAAVARVYLREIAPISRRAAAVARVYLREIAPLSRRAATVAGTYLREVAPIFRRAAAVAGTYLREIVPLYRRTASSIWWSDSALAFRRGWHRHSHGTVSDVAKRFGAICSMYLRQIVPLSRRAAATANMYLREIASISRRAAAFASLYIREIAPILRDVAARCWSDSKSVSRRHSWAVAAPNHSNPSQLR